MRACKPRPRPEEIADASGPQVREIVKARTIAKTICITLPKSVREPLSIFEGDRVMVRLDKVQRCLIVTKE